MLLSEQISHQNTYTQLKFVKKGISLEQFNVQVLVEERVETKPGKGNSFPPYNRLTFKSNRTVKK